MNPVYLSHLTTHELKTISAQKPLIIIPIGTIEWHSDHLPLGVDCLLSQATCDEISALTGCVVAPLISCGISRNLAPHKGYFGTIDTISINTLENLLVELGEGYAEMGFKVAALITGHGESEHFRAINTAISRSTAIKIVLLSAEDFTRDKIQKLADVEQTWPFATDHAAEWETSMMLHYYPELVDMGKAPETVELPMPGIPAYIRKRYPRRATPEYGRQLAQAVTDGGVKIINDLLASISGHP